MGSYFPQHLLQLVGWNKSSSKPIMRDIWHSKLVNGNQVLRFLRFRSLRQTHAMQMQSHAQADRCTGFLPNVRAYEITSAFHLLVRIWFIKWHPTTVLIYKANWCTVDFFSPLFLHRGSLEPQPCFAFVQSHTPTDTEKLHQRSWVWSASQVHSYMRRCGQEGRGGERIL